MASITPHRDGWRVQVYVRGHRDSRVFPGKREAARWGAQRELELQGLIQESSAPKYTLADALRKYAAEVAPQKRGFTQGGANALADVAVSHLGGDGEASGVKIYLDRFSAFHLGRATNFCHQLLSVNLPNHARVAYKIDAVLDIDCHVFDRIDFSGPLLG